MEQARQLAEAKADEPWLREAPSHCLRQALRDLDRACKTHGTWKVKWRSARKSKSSSLADSGGTDEDSAADTAVLRAQAKIAECGTKLSRHRAALEAGADPATVVRWIAETNAELALAETQIRTSGTKPRRTMTPEAIEELIAALGGLVEILHDADSADRQEVYRQLGLRLTYDPGKQEIRVEVNLHPDQLAAVHDRYHGVTVRVRGGTATNCTYPRAYRIGDAYHVQPGS